MDHSMAVSAASALVS